MRKPVFNANKTVRNDLTLVWLWDKVIPMPQSGDNLQFAGTFSKIKWQIKSLKSPRIWFARKLLPILALLRANIMKKKMLLFIFKWSMKPLNRFYGVFLSIRLLGFLSSRWKVPAFVKLQMTVFNAYLNVNTTHKIQKNLPSLIKNKVGHSIELFNQSILRLFNHVSVQSAVHSDTTRRYGHKKKEQSKNHGAIKNNLMKWVRLNLIKTIE